MSRKSNFKSRICNSITLLLIWLISPDVTANTTEKDSKRLLTSLHTQWAVVYYDLSGQDQLAAFEQLISKADDIVASHPDQPDLLIWRGIINATYAGAKRGRGALKYAETARADLERAIGLDEDALQGAAYTTLGTLYYRLPGWPFAFGDDKKAERLLRKGLSVNPNGIESNYFYADFLMQEGNIQEAEYYFRRALSAPLRHGKEKADRERRKQIQALLNRLKSSLLNTM